MPVYLLHLSRPLSRYSTTQHYIGCAADVEKRLLQHQLGQNGSKITQTAVERGITLTLVRTWEGTADLRDWELERKLKKQKNPWRLCPLCKDTERKAAQKRKRKRMNRKKNLTDAQRQETKERRGRFRSLVHRLANMDQTERMKLMERAGTIMTCERHPISDNNAMLAISQFPNATMIAGYGQWQKVGRHVREGEHGFQLWVPTKRGKDEDGKAQPTVDDLDATEPKFIMVSFFDISQTDEGISKRKKGGKDENETPADNRQVA